MKNVTIPSPGGAAICGELITGHGICGSGQLPDSYADFTLILGGAIGVIVNPWLLPFVCLDLDLAAISCTPLDLVASSCADLDLEPLVPLEA